MTFSRAESDAWTHVLALIIGTWWGIGWAVRDVNLPGFTAPGLPRTAALVYFGDAVKWAS